MYDIAERIEAAIKSGDVISGPLASVSMKVRQVFNPQGTSKSIQETRKVIRALAEGTVNARKALEGQGSITEQESAVAAKAESGDIDDLTIGELQILSDLNKRAALIRANEYKQLMSTTETDETTKNIAKFYKVEGIDKILKKGSPSSQTPASGGWAIRPK